MKTQFNPSEIVVTDEADYHRYLVLNFINSHNNFFEKITTKVDLDKYEVFDILTPYVGPVDTLEYNFRDNSFSIQGNNGHADILIITDFDSFEDMYMDDEKNNGKYEISIWCSDKDTTKRLFKEIEETFNRHRKTSIEWSYKPDYRGIRTKTLDIKGSPDLKKVLYPWLPTDTVQEYFKAYLEAPESVLLLTGVPGTGKTTFIRNLITENALNATITYDDKLINDDDYFISFMEDKYKDIMVLEDADDLLKDREKENNTLLKRILNISDGLVKNFNKKIVFSTNITDIDAIDTAITRPGRCFDILNFRPLTGEEAKAVAAEYGFEDVTESRKYTLAELFSKGQRRQRFSERKIGF